MNIRLQNYWDELRASYWFVPSLMVLFAIGLSFATLNFDRAQHATAARLQLFWGGGPEGARGLLEVIAGSMMTVASLTFSLTIVTFSQASAQFGPRLLRNFIRDTGNQVVLGTFVSTFVYCLLILRSIRSAVEAQPGLAGVEAFVPEFSISVGIVLALLSLGVLIYFIHHVSQSIYAPNVIANVAQDAMLAIDRLFPKEEDPLALPAEASRAPSLPDGFLQNAARLSAKLSGYLQVVDYYHLLAIASKYDLIIQVMHRPGHFVIYSEDLALVWPSERVTERLLSDISRGFILGKQRIAPQDVEFAIDQLVEIALRALSAAINDPFTAINCIDWLGVALSRLAQKDIPPPYHVDSRGQVRLVLTHPITFAGVTDAAFNQIRQQAGNQVAVRIRLLEVIAEIADHTEDPVELEALERQASMIRRGSEKHLEEQNDIADLNERFNEVSNE